MERGAIGPKGHDDSVLSGYAIVDDPLGAKNVTPTTDEDGEMCLHTEIEPYENEPSRGACADCGEEFGVRVASFIDGQSAEKAAEEEARRVDAFAGADAVAVG